MNSEHDASPARYFPVSPTKFVMMSVCTLGIYEIYWAWSCWEYIKSRDERNLNPFWRSVYVSALFFNFLLIWDVSRNAGDSKRVALVRSLTCGGGYAVLWLGGALLTQSPFVLASVVNVVLLVPVQWQINKSNQRDAPDHDPNRRFSKWNLVIVVIGGLFLLLAVVGSIIEPR